MQRLQTAPANAFFNGNGTAARKVCSHSLNATAHLSMRAVCANSAMPKLPPPQPGPSLSRSRVERRSRNESRLPDGSFGSQASRIVNPSLDFRLHGGVAGFREDAPWMRQSIVCDKNGAMPYCCAMV